MKDASENLLAAVRAAYHEGRDAEVVPMADRALLQVGPTSEAAAELHFLRGSSLRRLRRAEEALVALGAALNLGWTTPELRLERALAMVAAGRRQDAEQEMDEARRLAQDEDRRALLEKQWRSRDAKTGKFEARVRPQLGYDSNLVGVSDDTSLVEDADEESTYYGATLTATWRVIEDGDRLLALEYENRARVYASESDLSYTDNVLSLVGRLPLREAFAFTGRVAYGEMFLAEDGHFRTVRSAGPGFIVRPGRGWELALSGEWSDLDYYVDTPSEQDRDGTSQQVSLKVGAEFDGWLVRAFVTFLDYDAEGSDYDRTEWQFGATVTAPEAWGVQPSLTVAWTLADFENDNSLTGFTEERRDRRLAVTLRLTLRALEPVVGFAPTVSVHFEDWNSNIDAYDFERWLPQVDFSFLAFSF